MALYDCKKYMIMNHMETCAECKVEYEILKENLKLPVDVNVEPLIQFKKKLKRKRIVTVCVTAIITFAIVMGLAYYLYSPTIFQRGNPISYLSAAIKINSENPFVKVETDDNSSIIYISRKRVCEELLSFIAESEGVEFREQLGGAFLFSDGKKHWQ